MPSIADGSAVPRASPPGRMRHRLRVLEAACMLGSARVLLRVLPFRVIMRLAGGVRADQTPAAAHYSTRNAIAAGVGRALRRAESRLPWKSTCLVQALAGRFMLMRRGVASTLVLGVARQNGSIQAHAWLVCDGAVCGGAESGRFQPIASFR